MTFLRSLINVFLFILSIALLKPRRKRCTVSSVNDIALAIISLVANTCSVIDLLVLYASCNMGITESYLKLILFIRQAAYIFLRMDKRVICSCLMEFNLMMLSFCVNESTESLSLYLFSLYDYSTSFSQLIHLVLFIILFHSSRFDVVPIWFFVISFTYFLYEYFVICLNWKICYLLLFSCTLIGFGSLLPLVYDQTLWCCYWRKWNILKFILVLNRI